MSIPHVTIQTLLDIQERPAVMIDAEYRILAANTAYTDAYGVSPENVLGRTCHEVSHHSPLPCHAYGEQCPHREVFTTGKPCEALHAHFDAHDHVDQIRIQAYPVTGVDGQRYLMEVFQRVRQGEELSCLEMKMVGRSPAFLACFDNMTLAARSDVPILLFGESGTGKELAAEYIHQRSARSAGPYITLNCAAISESLFESELFGHERGAFTGSAGMKKGLFELAHHGTLFLDELAELPLSMQAKLLRVLDSGEYRRLGGEKILKADVRIIAATNRFLPPRIASGEFREDLYFRIAGMRIIVPPLRERRSDIADLADALLRRIAHPRLISIDASARERLLAHDFPGNVRELRNVLQNAVARCGGDVIHAEHLSLETAPQQASPPARRRRDDLPTIPLQHEMEGELIRQLLQKHKGNRSAVAYAMSVSERTIYRKMKRYRIG